MKLMGTSKLRDLAVSGVDGLSSSVAALRAELAAGKWETIEDVRSQYPAAVVDGAYVRIPIGDMHCVEIIANCDAGMILIEYAGSVGTASHKAHGRNAA